MARTILEIAREAAERGATAPRPATLFGTNDRIARVLRTAAKDTMREYLRSSRAKGLSEFHGTWVFATQPGRFSYPLPPDFLRMIPNTEFLNGWPAGLIGPVSPQTWSRWIAMGSTISAPIGWRLRNNIITLNPTPSEAKLVLIDYVSSYPVVSPVLESDLDTTGRFPMVNAPFVPRDGHATAEGYDATPTGSASTDFNFDAGDGFDDGVWPKEPSDVLKRINLLSTVGPKPMVRRPEFTADTDLPAFEDDYPLSLGMTFRLRRDLGLPYAEYAAEFEDELEMKQAEDGGGSRGFRVGQGSELVWDAIPVGAGRWLVS